MLNNTSRRKVSN